MESWHKGVIEGYVKDWYLVEDRQHGCRPWWKVPLNDSYFRNNLVPHLGGAGFLDEMATLVTRPFWIAKRVRTDGFSLFANDIIFAIAELTKFKTASSKEGMKAEELTIFKNALCLSHSFIFEDEAEIWFQLHSRLNDAAKRYSSIEQYVQYLVQNAPRPFLYMDEPNSLQAGTGIDMLTIYDSPVSCISLSEDGKVMLTGSENGLLSRGSVGDVPDITTQWTAHTSYVSCATLSDDAKFGVSGARDGSLVVIGTKKNQHVMDIETAHSSTVNSVSFCSTDANLVFSCGSDGSFCCWNFKLRKNIMRVQEAHGGKNVNAICEVVGGLLASGGDDSQIRFWDMKDFSEKKERRVHCESAVTKLVGSKNGQVLAAALRDGHVRVWNVIKGKSISDCFSLSDAFVSALCLSSGGELLAAGTMSGCSFVYDMNTKKRIGEVESNSGSVTSISLITVNNETLCVWATERGGVRVCESTRHEVQERRGNVRALSISSDENNLVIAHEDGIIEFIDLSTRETQKSVSTGRRLYVVKSLTEGAMVAYGCEDGRVGIWDMMKNKMVREEEVHNGVVLSIAISEDGTHMGSSGKDGIIRVWRLEFPNCCPLLIATAQLSPLYSVYFGEESTSDMVTVSDREASLWKNYQVVKTSEHDELTYCAGRFEAFQEVGRELFVRKRIMVTLRNRLYLLDVDGNMSRVGSFEVDVLPNCWAFSTLKNTLAVVGPSGIVHFATLSPDSRQSE